MSEFNWNGIRYSNDCINHQNTLKVNATKTRGHKNNNTIRNIDIILKETVKKKNIDTHIKLTNEMEIQEKRNAIKVKLCRKYFFSFR